MKAISIISRINIVKMLPVFDLIYILESTLQLIQSSSHAIKL